MCRISGIISKELPLQEMESMVDEMSYLQKHGGPDDNGKYTSSSGFAVLANRRLSLLDLSDQGHMPMSYVNRFYITYNGEIYNFLELKKELISLGHTFQNNTDTAVILAAFAQWGTLCFNKLNGMFAFALWDDLEQELFLVRDSVGIKPLYYYQSSSMLAFTSEVNAFNAIPETQIKNDNWPVLLMSYGFIPEPLTTLKSVKILPKGFFLNYSTVKDEISLQSFCHFSFSNNIIDETSAIESIKNQLSKSVKKHLFADSPIGIFLSGGLDSTILAYLASQIEDTNLKFISIYFDDDKYSEKKYQDTIINQIKADAYQFLVTKDNFKNSFPSILNDMDQPCSDGINTWFISNFTSSIGIKAALSGLGSDELFGGYPSFDRIKFAFSINKLPNKIKLLSKFSSSKKINRIQYLKLEGIKGIYLFLRGHFVPFETASHLGSYEYEIWQILKETPIFSTIYENSPKNISSWLEFNIYMQNQLLRDSDVMGMKNGVEIRVPFLDKELINSVFSITPDIKFKTSQPKQLLIKAYKDLIPAAIWDRPKMGFNLPFDLWFRDNDYVKELILNGNKAFKKSFVKFQEGKLHWSNLMSLIIINHRKHSF